MNWKRVGAAMLIGACAGCEAPPAAPAPAGLAHLEPVSQELLGFIVDESYRENLHNLVQGWIQQRAELDPNWATRTGIHEFDERLSLYNDVTWNRRRQLAADTLAYARQQLAALRDSVDELDARLFCALVGGEAHDYQRHDARTDTPGLPLRAVGAVNELLIGDFAPPAKRAALAVQRLEALPDVIAQCRARLDRPPRLWTQMAIREAEGALHFLDGVPALAGPAPGMAEAIADARAAVAGYRDWMQSELLPRSDGSFALGREEFEWRLHNVQLEELDADQLLALGRRQFDETLQQLAATARRIDPSSDWRTELKAMLQQHPAADALLSTYRDEVARTRQFLIEHDLVGIPDESLQIRETPAFLRTTIPFAAYHPPAPLDESRLGTFYVTPDPAAHIMADIPGTTWHETYPGHHLQFVYAKDNPSLVRRLNDSPLLSEGWGFYCEELASETGYFDDPHQRLMQLDWKLQRAARVILDTSIHAFGMSYEDAVAFLTDRVGLSRGTAEASVNAYTQQPTYYSCYLLGMIEIEKLRDACRERLGPRFTLREFHERLLRCGNVPPSLAARELEAWQ